MTTTASRKSAAPLLLIACPSLNRDDEACEMVELAIALQRRAGWQVHMASSGGSSVIAAERCGIVHTQLPLTSTHVWKRWSCQRRLAALITHMRPSAIHARGPQIITTMAKVAEHSQTRLIADITQPLPITPTTQAMFQALSTIPHHYRVPTAFLGNHLINDHHIKHSSIALIPSGIDQTWFSAASISAERLQNISRLWRLPEQSPLLMIATDLTPDCGIHEVFVALQKLKDLNIYTVIVGNDHAHHGQRARYESMVSSYDLNGRVIMPDDCPDWPAALWHASLVLAPSQKDQGENRFLLTAQSMERLVMATNCGALSELFDHNQSGWLVPTNDPDAFAETIRTALTLPPDQRTQMTHYGRSLIDQHFNQSRWIDAHSALYLNKKTGP